MLMAGVLAPVISASIGITSLALAGSVGRSALPDVWLTWWLGDATGAVVYAPLILFWLNGSSIRWTAQKTMEAGLLLATAILAGLLNFGVQDTAELAFLAFPVIGWAAFRFSQRETMTCVVAMSAMAIWGTLAGPERLSGPSEQGLLGVQIFTVVLGVSGMAVSALAFQHGQLLGKLEQRIAERTAALQSSNEALAGQIASRKRAEDKLRASEQRLLEAQAVAHVGSWDWDIHSDTVWWSDELCRIYGEEPGLTPSYEGFLQRVHPDDREAVRAVISRVYSTGEPFAFEHRIVRPDGSRRVLAASGRVVRDGDGRPVRMLGTGQDISDRKQAEAERAALEVERYARRRAEDASRMKDEFLALVSHELRTPLQAILGWAGRLREAPSDEERVAKGIDVIERNAQMQARLVADLLDVSAMSSGQLLLEARALLLASVIRSAVDAVAVSADAKRIQLVVNTVEDAQVQGDPSRLQQVVWNLLANAIKFTPEGGRVDVTLSTDPGYAIIQVADNGQGIDPDLLPHVFEPFWQGQSLPRRRGGLGLGLAIVRMLVEAHGGRVEVESKGLGRGATFTVFLPTATD
jgi:PAS domain S-box-containing protein